MSTAIRLFFEEKDTVSTYALAAAAQDLLRGLLRTRGEGSRIKDTDLVVPGREKEWRSGMNRPQNFFKHADEDPDGVLEFRPVDLVPFVILDCIDMYGRYVRSSPPDSVLFMTWFSLNYPDLIRPGTIVMQLVEKFHKENPFTEPRKDLFLEVLNHGLTKGDPGWLPS